MVPSFVPTTTPLPTQQRLVATPTILEYSKAMFASLYLDMFKSAKATTIKPGSVGMVVMDAILSGR